MSDKMIFIETIANDGSIEIEEYMSLTISSVSHSGMTLNVLSDGRVLIADSGDGCFLLST